MITKTNIASLVVICLLVAILPFVKHSILGANYVTLPSAKPLAGVISQSLGGAGKKTALPVEGKDYTATLHYFNSNTWVVAVIKPRNNSLNVNTIVFEKRQGTYQAVIGPATALPTSQLNNLPTNLADYTKLHIAIYQPVPEI